MMKWNNDFKEQHEKIVIQSNNKLFKNKKISRKIYIELKIWTVLI